MHVPWFSPRISLIEMALRSAPRSGCPVCHHRGRAMIGSLGQYKKNKK